MVTVAPIEPMENASQKTNAISLIVPGVLVVELESVPNTRADAPSPTSEIVVPSVPAPRVSFPVQYVAGDAGFSKSEDAIRESGEAWPT
jgi:hypothetical protein